MPKKYCLGFVAVVSLAALVLHAGCGAKYRAPAGSPVTFKEPVDISHGSVAGVSALCAADFDGDGRLDLAVIDGGKHAKQKTFAWFRGPGKEDEAWTRYIFNRQDPLKPFVGAVLAEDMDGDGDQDLVVPTDMHSGNIKDFDLLVFVNPSSEGGDVFGDWNYRFIASGLPYHHINDMRIADMDRDGNPDVVIRSLEPNEVHIFFQDNPGVWQQRIFPTNLEKSEGLEVGDLNGDELPEIAFTGFILVAPKNPRAQDYRRIAIDSEYWKTNQNTKEVLHDMDGDGLPDLVLSPAEKFRNGGNHNLAWYKNPGGNLEAPWTATIVEADTNNMHTVLVGLVNDDPFPDIVTGTAWDPKQITVYYNQGKGRFAAGELLPEGKGLYSGLLVDIDGDGDLDIIGQDGYSGESKPYVYESRLVD